MKALIDTSILVAALSQTHLDHYRALSVFKQIKGGQLDAIISAHTLAECYAVLTRLPVQPRISPQQAWQAISHDVLSIMLVFALTAADYRDVIEHLAQTTLPAASPTTRSSAGSQ